MTTQSRKVLFRIAITLALLPAVLLLALWIKPPHILRVGANYSAKIICSNVFIAGRVGMLVKEGRLALDQSAGWPATGDGRDKIRIADLLAMSSGLRFNEA